MGGSCLWGVKEYQESCAFLVRVTYSEAGRSIGGLADWRSSCALCTHGATPGEASPQTDESCDSRLRCHGF